jgi:hypothetical protein
MCPLPSRLQPHAAESVSQATSGIVSLSRNVQPECAEFYALEQHLALLLSRQLETCILDHVLSAGEEQSPEWLDCIQERAELALR